MQRSHRRIAVILLSWFVGSCAPLPAMAPQAPPAAPEAKQEPAPVEVGLAVLAAAGASTARDPVLLQLQGGAHDPRQRGFTLQQAELSVAGNVEGWGAGKAILIAAIAPEDGETIVELEEAYLRTHRSAAGLDLQVGTFFTGFGRSNVLHPHAWDWQDQPVMNTRVFGGDGMRGPGARGTWSLPGTPRTELQLGAQNAHGETMPSFLANEEVYAERAIGGRTFAAPEVRNGGDLMWSLRAVTAFGDDHDAPFELGASLAFGPNATGDGADTVIYGADFMLRCGDAEHAGSLTLLGEWTARAFEAAPQVDAADPQQPFVLPATTLHDHGGQLQALWGCAADWQVGVRGEYATGSGASYRGGGSFARSDDPWRCDRLRLSPLLVWRPSPAARVRLQYDYDDSDHLGGEVHSVWLGFDVRLGAHAGHTH